MLEQIEIVFPGVPFAERGRGALSAAVAREFPPVLVSFGTDEDARPFVRASQWDRPDFDSWTFDTAIDELAARPFALCIADDRGERGAFPLEVLNRCQRAIGRRNTESESPRFDRVLRHHRVLHDLSKPLVRADYDHALDVWQWVLRLDPSAPLAAQLAALFHDVERLISEADARVEHRAADYQEFKDEHARRGASLASRILAEAGVALATCEAVGHLIAEHEHRAGLLADADALSFFSLNSNGYADYFGPDQARRKIAWTWKRMSVAARRKLKGVHLRADVRQILEEVKG